MSAIGQGAQGAQQGFLQGANQAQNIFAQELERRRVEREELDSASQRSLEAQTIRLRGTREARDQRSFDEALKPFTKQQATALAEPLGADPSLFLDMPRAQATELAQILGRVKAAAPGARTGVVNTIMRGFSQRQRGIEFQIRQIDRAIQDAQNFFEQAIRLGLDEQAQADILGVPLQRLREARATGTLRAEDVAIMRQKRNQLVKQLEGVQNQVQSFQRQLGASNVVPRPQPTSSTDGPEKKGVRDLITDEVRKALGGQ